jgi:hypothetical protein
MGMVFVLFFMAMMTAAAISLAVLIWMLVWGE